MLEFLREFAKFLAVRKKYWLIPIFAVTFLVAVLLLLASSSAVAPFIYTIF
jgi:hypothetical protein